VATLPLPVLVAAALPQLPLQCPMPCHAMPTPSTWRGAPPDPPAQGNTANALRALPLPGRILQAAAFLLPAGIRARYART